MHGHAQVTVHCNHEAHLYVRDRQGEPSVELVPRVSDGGATSVALVALELRHVRRSSGSRMVLRREPLGWWRGEPKSRERGKEERRGEARNAQGEKTEKVTGTERVRGGQG